MNLVPYLFLFIYLTPGDIIRKHDIFNKFYTFDLEKQCIPFAATFQQKESLTKKVTSSSTFNETLVDRKFISCKILQVSCKLRESCKILSKSQFLQDSCMQWHSCNILGAMAFWQDSWSNGILARFLDAMAFLQDSWMQWHSCKILAGMLQNFPNLQRSSKTLQETKFLYTHYVPIIYVFLQKASIINH